MKLAWRPSSGIAQRLEYPGHHLIDTEANLTGHTVHGYLAARKDGQWRFTMIGSWIAGAVHTEFLPEGTQEQARAWAIALVCLTKEST